MNATDANGVVVVPIKTPKVGSGILEHWEQTYDPTEFAGFNRFAAPHLHGEDEQRPLSPEEGAEGIVLGGQRRKRDSGDGVREPGG